MSRAQRRRTIQYAALPAWVRCATRLGTLRYNAGMDRILRALRSIPGRLEPLWLVEKPGGQVRISLRYPLALVAFGLVLTWYIARPSPVAVMAAVGLGGMLGAGYVWARRMAIGISAERRLQYAAVQVGDEIEEIVTLRNESILPTLWAEFSDHSNIPGYNLTSVRVVDGKSSLQWRAHAVCQQRGNYRFGPWELLTGDPFGLFKVTLSYTQQEEILIYPPLAALPQQMLPRGRSQGDDRPLHQPLQAESLSALSSRPYAPGDPLRRIHWPTTARHGTPFVKTFDPESASTVWLIPDLDSAVQRGEGPELDPGNDDRAHRFAGRPDAQRAPGSGSNCLYAVPGRGSACPGKTPPMADPAPAGRAAGQPAAPDDGAGTRSHGYLRASPGDHGHALAAAGLGLRAVPPGRSWPRVRRGSDPDRRRNVCRPV